MQITHYCIGCVSAIISCTGVTGDGDCYLSRGQNTIRWLVLTIQLAEVPQISCTQCPFVELE